MWTTKLYTAETDIVSGTGGGSTPQTRRDSNQARTNLIFNILIVCKNTTPELLDYFLQQFDFK